MSFGMFGKWVAFTTEPWSSHRESGYEKCGSLLHKYGRSHACECFRFWYQIRLITNFSWFCFGFQKEISSKVCAMGGKTRKDLSSTVTHLVAPTVGSKKYFVGAASWFRFTQHCWKFLEWIDFFHSGSKFCTKAGGNTGMGGWIVAVIMYWSDRLWFLENPTGKISFTHFQRICYNHISVTTGYQVQGKSFRFIIIE